MNSAFKVDHPLVEAYITCLRDRDTSSADFRLLVGRLAVLVACEATRDLALTPSTVHSPVAKADGAALSQRIGIVPILRAGLGMADAVLNLIPEAEVWHLGLYRDEATAQPVEYYQNLPEGDPVDVALVLDPMLATGGSAVAAIESLQRWGVDTIKVCALIAAEPGLQVVLKRFPKTQVYACAVDALLNERNFIVPGLGDAGDRIFDTRH